nr:T9SS type A sorting domain-containing protein [Breznakibacter sp.]
YDHSYGIDTIIIKSNVEIGRHAFPTMNKFVVDNKAYPTVKFDIPSPGLTMEQNSFFGNFGYLDFPVYNWLYRKKSTDTYYSWIQNINGQAYNDSTQRVLIAPWGYLDSNTYNFPDAANLNLRNWMLSTDSSKVGSVDLYVTKGTKTYYQNSNVWKYFNLVEFGNSIPTYLADTKSLEIKIYPNPFHNGFNINANDNSQTYSIIDISGSVLQTFSANEKQYINMSSFPNGIYFLKNNVDNRCTKLIKQ